MPREAARGASPRMQRAPTTGLSRARRLVGALCVAVCATALPQRAASPQVVVEPDGTVHLPAQTVPVSGFLSPEGRAYLAEHLRDLQRPELLVQEDGVPALLAGYIARQRELFPVEREETTIGGVHAYVYTPRSGIAAEHRDRVLINLHGGGFSECWPACAELESMPIAALGRIKVVSLDYRQGPQHSHPAASEDVAAAYGELLETYRPANIGIYGCSAGGMLTAMSVAWFQQHELPRPGAIGLLCAGAASVNGEHFGGDASYTALPLGDGRVLPAGSAGGPVRMNYLASTDPDDPLVAPASSPEVLAKFPPTLIVTGTRAFELSNAVYTHTQLVKNGVDAALHVWEGMFHGFFYNPDVPESRECYDVIVRFFADRLGRR
jgi:monoterpene epsilon-lactone hydrolase